MKSRLLWNLVIFSKNARIDKFFFEEDSCPYRKFIHFELAPLLKLITTLLKILNIKQGSSGISFERFFNFLYSNDIFFNFEPIVSESDCIL